jgi:quercetin dioxygenase-like cupin family protein
MTTSERHSYLEDHEVSGDELSFDLKERLAALHVADGQSRAGVALAKESGLNIVLTRLKRGTQLSEHAARGPVSIQVLEGRVRLAAGGRSDELSSGQLAVVDAEVPHSLDALEDCALLITASMPQPEGGDIRESAAPAPN